MNSHMTRFASRSALLFAAAIGGFIGVAAAQSPDAPPPSAQALVADVLNEEKRLEDRLQAFEAILRLPRNERSVALWRIMEQATDGSRIGAARRLIEIADAADDARLAEWTEALSADQRSHIISEIAVRALVAREPVCPQTARAYLNRYLNTATVPERNRMRNSSPVDSAAIALRGHLDPDDLQTIRGLLAIDPHSPGLWRARSTAGVPLDPTEFELARSVWRDADAPWSGRVAAAAAAAAHRDARAFIESYVDNTLETYGDLSCVEMSTWRWKGWSTEEGRRLNQMLDEMKVKLSGLGALADADPSFDISAMLTRCMRVKNEAIQGLAMIAAAYRHPGLLVEGDHLAEAEPEGLLRSRVLAARLHPDLEERLLAEVDVADAARVRRDIETMGFGGAAGMYATLYSY